MYKKMFVTKDNSLLRTESRLSTMNTRALLSPFFAPGAPAPTLLHSPVIYPLLERAQGRALIFDEIIINH